MVARYEICYARSGGVNLAYCTWGEGDEVVVYTPPLVSNVELMWDLTVKTTGDGMLAVFNDPLAALHVALELEPAVRELGLASRAGLHAGQIEERDDGDVAGIAVNIAARVQALAAPGEVLTSQTVRDLLLGTTVAFAERGTHRLKGVDGDWHIYAASGS